MYLTQMLRPITHISPVKALRSHAVREYGLRCLSQCFSIIELLLSFCFITNSPQIPVVYNHKRFISCSCFMLAGLWLCVRRLLLWIEAEGVASLRHICHSDDRGKRAKANQAASPKMTRVSYSTGQSQSHGQVQCQPSETYTSPAAQHCLSHGDALVCIILAGEESNGARQSTTKQT